MEKLRQRLIALRDRWLTLLEEDFKADSMYRYTLMRCVREVTETLGMLPSEAGEGLKRSKWSEANFDGSNLFHSPKKD